MVILGIGNVLQKDDGLGGFMLLLILMKIIHFHKRYKSLMVV